MTERLMVNALRRQECRCVWLLRDDNGIVLLPMRTIHHSSLGLRASSESPSFKTVRGLIFVSGSFHHTVYFLWRGILGWKRKSLWTQKPVYSGHRWKKNLALRSRVGFIENTGHGGDVAQLTECLPSMHTTMGLIHSTTESEPGVTHL